MRNRHTTPFEMAELKFHIKLPYFVAAQMVRHRTANINAESARYSIFKDEFYIPEPLAVSAQSKDNKQGRGEVLPSDVAQEVRDKLEEHSLNAFELYHYLLNVDEQGIILDEDRIGVAKELARIPLPESTYTQWYWKMDLHNLFHFLGLRKDPHAQFEIRQYADAISEIVKEAFPHAYKAFEDFQLNAKIITGPEIEIMAGLFQEKGFKISEDDVLRIADQAGLKNKRERNEMVEKFKKMGVISE